MDPQAIFASSVKGILGSVPVCVRSSYASYLPQYHGNCLRAFEAAGQVATMQALLQKGSFISAINAIKKPVLQLSGEFIQQGGNGTKDWRSIEDEVLKCRNNVANLYINAKTNEAHYYRSRYILEPALVNIGDDLWNLALARLLQTYDVSEKKQLPKALVKELERFEEERQKPLRLCASLAESQFRESQARKEKKFQKRKEADMAMTEDKDMSKTISMAVESHFKKQRQSKNDKKMSKQRLTAVKTGKIVKRKNSQNGKEQNKKRRTLFL